MERAANFFLAPEAIRQVTSRNPLLRELVLLNENNVKQGTGLVVLANALQYSLTLKRMNIMLHHPCTDFLLAVAKALCCDGLTTAQLEICVFCLFII